ncbi:MAG: FxsA family protein [Mobilicoccus sp.]|nr:FxsA family protein [Mobilicoccus sp.]
MSTPSHPGGPSTRSTPAADARRPRLGRFILLTLLLLPILELVALVAVGQTIGVWWTLGLLLGLSILGAVLMKTEGRSTWRALDAAVRTGKMPAKEALDATLVMAGGLLLLLPGFLTDIVGLILILPFTRPLVRDRLAARAERSVMTQAGVVRSVTVESAPTSEHTGEQARPVRGEIVEGVVVDEPDERR